MDISSFARAIFACSAVVRRLTYSSFSVLNLIKSSAFLRVSSIFLYTWSSSRLSWWMRFYSLRMLSSYYNLVFLALRQHEKLSIDLYILIMGSLSYLFSTSFLSECNWFMLNRAWFMGMDFSDVCEEAGHMPP